MLVVVKSVGKLLKARRTGADGTEYSQVVEREQRLLHGCKA